MERPLDVTDFCWIGGTGEDDTFYYRIQSDHSPQHSREAAPEHPHHHGSKQPPQPHHHG